MKKLLHVRIGFFYWHLQSEWIKPTILIRFGFDRGNLSAIASIISDLLRTLD